MAKALMNRSVFLTVLLSGVVCALLGAPLHAQEAPSPVSADRARMQKQAENIVKRYVKLLNQNGVSAAHAPKVRLGKDYTYTQYPKRTDKERGDADPTITVPYWEDVSPDTRSLFEKWAPMSEPGMTGRTLFEDGFIWLTLPFMLTYVFQNETHVDLPKDHFGSEVMANRFVVAFWLTQKDSRQHLVRMAKACRRLQQALPDPVPSGEDPMHYYNVNYDKIAPNPLIYGWFQIKMIADAYDERETLKFGKMVQDAGREKAKPSEHEPSPPAANPD